MQGKEASAATWSRARRQADRPAAGPVGWRSIGSSRRRRIAVAASAALALSAASTAPAQAAIEVDHGIEFVNLTDVPQNADLLLTVTAPDGSTIGSKRFNTSTGAYEVNHTGAADGDCWDGNTSPDVRAGDTLSVSDTTGVLQSYTVADVRYEARFEAATLTAPATMTVSGWAKSADGTAPIAAPELRLQRGPFDANATVTGGSLDQNRGNRLLIGPDQDATGAFLTTVSPTEADQVSEAILEVIEGANATSFSGDSAFALPGCPALDTTRGQVVVPQLPPLPGDTDGDTLADNRDRCPNVAGPVNNDGCPVTVPQVVIDNTKPSTAILQQIPGAGAVAGVKAGSVAPARLTLSRLSMIRTVARSAVRANGLTATMRLAAGTKVLRVRIYRRNAGGTRSLVAERFLAPAARGQYRMRLKDRKLRQALKAGSYEAQMVPGRSRTSFGKTSKLTFRVTP